MCILNLIAESVLGRVSLGTTVRLLLYDLEVTSLNPKNNLFACVSKVEYMYLLQTPPGGSLMY